MSAKINYLSIQIKIGSQILALETDDPSREFYSLGRLADPKIDLDTLDKKIYDVQDQMKKALNAGFTLKMEKGKAINVTIGELKSWVNSTSKTGSNNLESFFKTATKASDVDDISIQLWNLSIGYSKGTEDEVKLSFTFYIKVTLDTGLLDAIFPKGNPITNIVDITSLGLGMTFNNYEE